MAMLDVPVLVTDAMLLADGVVVLEVMVGAEGRVTTVRMPASGEARRLADPEGGTVFLAVDELPTVAPVLAREIGAFVAALGHRLTVSAIGR